MPRQGAGVVSPLHSRFSVTRLSKDGLPTAARLSLPVQATDRPLGGGGPCEPDIHHALETARGTSGLSFGSWRPPKNNQLYIQAHPSQVWAVRVALRRGGRDTSWRECRALRGGWGAQNHAEREGSCKGSFWGS